MNKKIISEKIEWIIAFFLMLAIAMGSYTLGQQVVSEQVENAFRDIPAEKAAKAVIAYEPIWAIGTGRTATPVQANMMCTLIRETLIEMYGDETADKVIIQYGGSVKPENATDIMNMEEIDGALVGGASLEPLKFIEIVNF